MAVVVAMYLLLGVGSAQAQTYDSVEKDGDTVTAIRGLQLGVYIYDIVFPTESADELYNFSEEVGGATPDFTTQADALAAVLVVNNILEAEGALAVGELDAPPSLEFNIGYGSVTEDGGRTDPIYVFVESGRTGPNPPPAWEALDTDTYNILETHTWADFTIVGFAGDGNLSPTAEANGRYTGVVGVEVAFSSRGSNDPLGSIETYEWDFGDDATGSGPTPSHIYTEPGVYIVTLTVTDDDGVPDSDFTTALIAPTARPEADPNGPYVGEIGDDVAFDGSGSSDPDGSIVAYEWDFGDKTAIVSGPTPTASHTYMDSGVYIVTLTVTDDSGASDSTRTTAIIATGSLPPVAEAGSPVIGTEGMEVEFDGRLSRAPTMGGSIVAYEWDFGDGSPFGEGETPSHIYEDAGNYNVTLTVTDNKGKTDSDHTLATIVEASALDCSDARPSRDTIWPPGRRFVTVKIRGVDSDGSPVIITIDSIRQDEPVFFIDGFGVGIPTEPARVRAFRWPTAFGGNGRVYTIGFTAVDIRGGTCSGEVKVEVPISEGDKAVDDGATYDSTVSSFFDF